MNRSLVRLSLLYVAMAAVASIGCSQVRAASVLIYSDHTPGSLVFYEAERQVAEGKGHTVTTVTDVSDFEDELSSGPWEYVVGVARYASGEPAYADELRAYANGDHPVSLFIWHDNGTNPGIDTAVMGTTAIAMWYNGRTTVGYANTTGVLGGAATTSGLSFPTFSSIPTVNPTVLVEASPEQIQGLSSGAIIQVVLFLLSEDSQCLIACLDALQAGNDACDATFEGDTADCNTLYPVPPPSNNDNRNACLDEASKVWSNCRSGKDFTYKNCVALCES